ncbi:hypothetical protein DITRI_Ditri04bG0077400 [Diplodiscus trichospermus]
MQIENQAYSDMFSTEVALGLLLVLREDLIEILISLAHQIKDLEKQLKERKVWAHQKVMDAARKLNCDLTELKMLRMEKDEMQWIKKRKHTIPDSTTKNLSKVENALRNAYEQLNLANAGVRWLEIESAKIIAEIEASKLAKLQEEIASEKNKIKELQQCLARVEQDQKEIELRWREESNAKKLALAQVQEEQRFKEATKARNKRRRGVIRKKIEIDFQHYRDDYQQLEQELSCLK